MPEEFDFSQISEELLGLFGIWKILKDIDADSKILLHLKNGEKIEGVKQYFDEQLGIIGLLARFDFASSTQFVAGLDGKQVPKTESKYIYFRYALKDIIGVGTFPDIKPTKG